MLSTIVDWISTALFIVALGLLMRWLRTPSTAIQTQIERNLRARGLTILDVSTDLAATGVDRSEIVYMARVKNPFGNVEVHRFAAGRWSNMLSKSPTVREL